MSSPYARSPWVLAAALFVGAAGAGYAASADGDIWWHLAAGREMVRTGALLRTDPFSIDAAGRSWPDVHWLFQLVSYGLYAMGGLAALVLAKCIVVGASALLLFFAEKRSRSEQVLFVVLFLGALFAARDLLLVRPVIATLLFLSTFVFVLERHRSGGNARALAVLPFLQIVWVNCQGLSPFGPALVLAYALGATAPTWLRGVRWKALLATLLACMTACLATPFGYRAVTLPGSLLARLLPDASNVYAPNIAENVPPLLLEQVSPGQFTFLPWFLGLLALTLLVAARRIVLSQALVVAPFVALALLANRNVVLLYWIATPLIARGLAPFLVHQLDRFAVTRAPLVGRALAGISIVACLSAIATSAAGEPSLREPTPFRMPVESADWLQHHAGGRIFAADHQGGYLMWRLFPKFRPFIDTRLVLRTADEFAEFLRVIDDPQRFDAFDDRYSFDYVLLPTAYPERYLRLVAHLYESARWQLVFTNGSEVLFARRSAESEPLSAWDLSSAASCDRVLSTMQAKYSSPRLLEAARLQFATLELAIGEFAQCDRILAPFATSSARSLRARCFLAAGDLAHAEALASQLLSPNPDDLQGLDLLAMVSARYGDRERAAGYLRRALSVDPFDVEANHLLTAMEVRHGHP